LQDTSKSIKESKGITSHFGGPVSWRKVLKELNANHPDPSPAAKQARSPQVNPALVVPHVERSPVVKPRQPEFRNLDDGTPAGRAAGPFMDVSVIGRAALGAVPSVPSLIASPVVTSAASGCSASQPLSLPVPQLPGQLETKVQEQGVVPRQLATEAFDSSPSLRFSMSDAHPMVMPEEKAFIVSCLQAFTDIVEREGGFLQYMEREDCKARTDLFGILSEEEPLPTPQEMLRRSCENLIRQAVRNGYDSIGVQLGAIHSMGMKKVVMVEVTCEDLDMHVQRLSICWDWEVKLEHRPLNSE
jgi:hypothetical protein